MDPDVSDFDCPQFVNFNSEKFQQSLNNVSLSDEEASRSLKMTDIRSPSVTSTSSISCIEESSSSKCITDDSLNVIQDKENHCYGSEEQTFLHAEKKPVKKQMKMGTTVPKPFHFSTDSRLKSKKQKSDRTPSKKRKFEEELVPLAEQINAFQKVPKRFHTTNKAYEPSSHWEPPVLDAKSPNLQAVKRRRVVTAVSREQQEEKEIEEMKKYQFHAKPVDPRIYNSKLRSYSSFSKQKNKSNVSISKVSQKVRRKTVEKTEKYVFKARPVPKAILAGTTGLKEKPVIQATVPKEPKFEVENRLEQRKILDERKQEEKRIEEERAEAEKRKAHNKTSLPKCSPPKRTEMKPFSFDRADKQRFEQKEQKIQKEIENESKPFVFRAQLMPLPTVSGLPPVSRKPATKPQPFNFETDTRATKHGHSFASDSQESEFSFKAQPATVLKKEPFIPVKPERSLCEPEEFHLHSDLRAAERQRQKELKEAEEAELAQLRQEREAREAEREREETARLRQELVHRAQPVRHYKPVEVKRGLLPVTAPVSPEFEVEKRIQKRHEQQ